MDLHTNQSSAKRATPAAWCGWPPQATAGRRTAMTAVCPLPRAAVHMWTCARTPRRDHVAVEERVAARSLPARSLAQEEGRARRRGWPRRRSSCGGVNTPARGRRTPRRGDSSAGAGSRRPCDREGAPRCARASVFYQRSAAVARAVELAVAALSPAAPFGSPSLGCDLQLLPVRVPPSALRRRRCRRHRLDVPRSHANMLPSALFEYCGRSNLQGPRRRVWPGHHR
jgi:hypothetical protein